MLCYQNIQTPLGWMQAFASERGICFLEFTNQKDFEKHWLEIISGNKIHLSKTNNQYLTLLENELGRYFKGELHEFSIPLDIQGTTFQQSVWQSLLSIPYGDISTYHLQAINIHKPQSVRAVANAIGQNKIAILIPCHRVIGTNGSITGYAGGVWRKEKLLSLEENFK